jgi:hypothetical protein
VDMSDSSRDEIGEDGRSQSGRVHDKFWERVDCVRCGALVVDVGEGSGGRVRLQSRRDAAAFGHNLFQHLVRTDASQGSEETGDIKESGQAVPAWRISDLLRERCCGGAVEGEPKDESEFSDMLEMCLQAGQLFGYTPDMVSEGFPSSLQAQGGRSQSQQVAMVSEGQLVAGVCVAYRSLRSASASLVNLQDLHRSVTDIADNVFWGGILLLLQMVFGMKTFAALTPLLTIVFGLSFALGPSVGNLCLSVVFVMFLLPYDVGNKVCIANSNGSRDGGVVGNVSSITLGYTTIVTTLNEKLCFPNHVLFHRAIVNMHESVNAVFEVLVELPLVPLPPPAVPLETFRDVSTAQAAAAWAGGGGGGGNVPGCDVHGEFWRRVGVAVREKRVDEWLEMAVYCREIRHETNSVCYCLRLTHRAGWHEV